jgi:IclR family transcriptional regulator, acetate operon repressor
MATSSDRASGPDSASKPNYPIGSVDSALRLLALLAEHPSVRIAEASKRLDVARSTAHRLMQMLQYHGLAQQDPESKSYTAGPVLISLGLQAVRNLDERLTARPYIERLMEEVNETVLFLALQDGGQLLVLDSVEPSRALRVGNRTAMVLPAYASAAGRAILATLPAERIRKLYPSARLPRLHPGTIATRKELMDELELTRERGFAVQRTEIEPDVSAVAAHVPTSRGVAQHAVAITVPASRFTDDDVPRLGVAVMACSAAIAAALPV